MHEFFAINIDKKPDNDLSIYLSNQMPSSINGLNILESNTNAILAGQTAYFMVYTDSDTYDSKTMEIGYYIWW